jgi:hypothetical protein
MQGAFMVLLAAEPACASKVSTQNVWQGVPVTLGTYMMSSDSALDPAAVRVTLCDPVLWPGLQLVLQMLRAMFDLVDALAALQQAVSVRVEGLSGSWGWMVLRVAGAWAALLLQVMQLADATAAHMLGPTTDTSAALLSQVGSLSIGKAWRDPGPTGLATLLLGVPTRARQRLQAAKK